MTLGLWPPFQATRAALYQLALRANRAAGAGAAVTRFDTTGWAGASPSLASAVKDELAAAIRTAAATTLVRNRIIMVAPIVCGAELSRQPFGSMQVSRPPAGRGSFTERNEKRNGRESPAIIAWRIDREGRVALELYASLIGDAQHNHVSAAMIAHRVWRLVACNSVTAIRSCARPGHSHRCDYTGLRGDRADRLGADRRSRHGCRSGFRDSLSGRCHRDFCCQFLRCRAG